MDLGLAGKTTVIAGGSGRGLVLEFAREGANVVSVDQDSGGHLALFLASDVSSDLTGQLISVSGGYMP